MKGLAISNSELIRSVHNSFARSDPFVNEMVDPNAGKDQDVYHFIAFTPIHGALYELDGLSRGPVNLGPCDDSNWVQKANEAIKKRMESYGSAALHFSLMALIKDKVEQMEEMIEETDGILLSLSEDDVEARNRANQDRMMYEQVLQQEQEKRKKWHVSLEVNLCFWWVFNWVSCCIERKCVEKAQLYTNHLQPIEKSCREGSIGSTSRSSKRKGQKQNFSIKKIGVLWNK